MYDVTITTSFTAQLQGVAAFEVRSLFPSLLDSTLLEEGRLLGYKNPSRTSQETHYLSVIEPSRLMLCKV
jgi:hypothetical protein